MFRKVLVVLSSMEASNSIVPSSCLRTVSTTPYKEGSSCTEGTSARPWIAIYSDAYLSAFRYVLGVLLQRLRHKLHAVRVGHVWLAVHLLRFFFCCCWRCGVRFERERDRDRERGDGT